MSKYFNNQNSKLQGYKQWETDRAKRVEISDSYEGTGIPSAARMKVTYNDDKFNEKKKRTMDGGSSKWRTEAVEKLSSKKYGRKYQDRLNKLMDEAGIPQTERNAFGKWMDANEAGVSNNSVKGYKAREIKPVEKQWANELLPKQPVTAEHKRRAGQITEAGKKADAAKSEGSILNKLLGGAKKIGSELSRFDDIATNAMTFGAKAESEKRIQKRLDKGGSSANLTEYLKPRADGNIAGKGVDMLASLAGMTVPAIGATGLLRGVGATGKGINALTQAHKAGTVTKPLLKRAALDSLKEGALVGGAIALPESAVRLGLNKESNTTLKDEAKHVAMNVALGAALDPLLTVGAPAMKMASRNAVDKAIGHRASRDVIKGLGDAHSNPTKAGELIQEQMRQGSDSIEGIAGRSDADRVLKLLTDGQVDSAKRASAFKINNPEADQARQVMQILSDTKARKITNMDAEESLAQLIGRERSKLPTIEPNRTVPTPDNPKVNASDSLQELPVQNPRVQELLAQRTKLESGPHFTHSDQLKINKIDDELALLEKEFVASSPVPNVDPDFVPLVRAENVPPKVDNTNPINVLAQPQQPKAANPLDALVNPNPVRPPAQEFTPEQLAGSAVDRTVKKKKLSGKNALTDAQKALTNDLAPVERIEDAIEGMDADGLINHLRPKTNLGTVASKFGLDPNTRLTGGKPQRAVDSSLSKKILNSRNAPSIASKKVIDRYEPFTQKVNSSKTVTMDKLGDYATDKHIITLGTKAADEKAMVDTMRQQLDNLTMQGKAGSKEALELESSINKSKLYELPEGESAELSMARVAEYEKNPEMVELYKDFVAIQRQNLDNALKGQMITKESYDEMLKNETYVSMQHNFDMENPYGTSRHTVSSPIRKMKGGSKEKIKDPINGAMMNAYVTELNVVKNDALLPVLEKYAAIDKEGALFRGVKEPNSSTVKVYKNGKEIYFEVPSVVKNIIQKMNVETDPNIVLGTVQNIADFQRKLTTQYSLSFQLKSAIREPVQAAFTSRTAQGDLAVVKNISLGFLDATFGKNLERIGIKSWKNTYKELGGTGFQFIHTSDDDLVRLSKQMMEKGTAKGGIRKLNPFNLLAKFGENVESAARLGEFRSAKNQGYSDADALFEAVDLTNYKRSGSWTREANKYMPFLNATIQGNSRVARAIGEAPVKTILRGGTMLSSTALAAYALREHASPEQQQELDNLNQWEKDMYLHIVVPNDPKNTIIALPKAFAVGQMFMNPIERGLDDYYGKTLSDPNVADHVKQGLKSTMKSFAPPVEVAGATTAYELWQNKSLFTKQEIESEYDKEAGVEKKDIEAYNQSYITNLIADFMNASTFSDEGWVSPAQVDYVLKDLIGSVGTSTMEASDQVLRENAPTKTWQDQLLKPINQFKADPTRASGVYDPLKKLARTEKTGNNSMSKMSKEEKAAEKASRPLQNRETEFKELNKELQAVRNDTSLSAEQKKNRIILIRKQQDELGSKTIDWYNSMN